MVLSVLKFTACLGVNLDLINLTLSKLQFLYEVGTSAHTYVGLYQE